MSIKNCPFRVVRHVHKWFPEQKILDHDIALCRECALALDQKSALALSQSKKRDYQQQQQLLFQETSVSKKKKKGWTYWRWTYWWWPIRGWHSVLPQSVEWFLFLVVRLLHGNRWRPSLCLIISWQWRRHRCEEYLTVLLTIATVKVKEKEAINPEYELKLNRTTTTPKVRNTYTVF